MPLIYNIMYTSKSDQSKIKMSRKEDIDVGSMVWVASRSITY